MNIAETKKYLENYRRNMARVARLKNDIQLFSVSAPILQKEIEECIKNSHIIEGIIISHTNNCQREIMLRKYVYGQTLEKIAEDLNYSPRHIQRILNAAVLAVGSTIN